MEAYGNDELAVWPHSDPSGRVIPVECVIPPELLREASTNAPDFDAREKAASMGQAV